MTLLSLDLGGTKLASAVFSEAGDIIHTDLVLLAKRGGKMVGSLISTLVKTMIAQQQERLDPIRSIGISVPGVYDRKSGRVWVPNIPGWEDYPLLDEIKLIAGDIHVVIDSDRACYILGEVWKGNARGCRNAVFLAVGTGIGAGILVNGEVMRGAGDIAGAIGWMALERPHKKSYVDCGCFESQASGEGIAKLALAIMSDHPGYEGSLCNRPAKEISAYDILNAYEQQDVIARKTIRQCIELWGMVIANLVSILNPEKIIFGGGVFGPAVKFIPAIKEEAIKWAQPRSMQSVVIEASMLGSQAGLYGAAFTALQQLQEKRC